MPGHVPLMPEERTGSATTFETAREPLLPAHKVVVRRQTGAAAAAPRSRLLPWLWPWPHKKILYLLVSYIS